MAGGHGTFQSDGMVVLVVVTKTVQTMKEEECSISKVYVFEQRTKVQCIHKISMV